jgi:uncharacterized iron-regulated protein
MHGKAVSEDEIEVQAAAADIVYLGEKHDNPEHHQLQARVLAALVKKGARPSVVFEMIEDDQQALLDGLAARPNVTPADYRAALAWDKSGWPDFALYEPIFAIAIAAKLHIVGGNAPTSLVKHVAFTGEGAGNLSALPAPAEQDLESELADSHCGALPPEALPSMALAQRVRDARIAQHAREAEKSSHPRSVVIAGNGHTRIDRGAPWAALQVEPTLRQLSISFQEVSASPDPNPPYDVVWTTAAMPPEDHCKNFHMPHAQK